MCLSHCAPPERQPILPFGDGENFELLADMVYYVRDSPDSLVVPRGFVTDFASIPKELQSFISLHGRHILPGVIHDYLYWEQICSREQADRIFLIAMEEMGVSWKREAMYHAVDKFGVGAWKDNRDDREAGLTRVVPEKGVRRSGPTESWPDYREHLREAGADMGPPAKVSKGFCGHGDRQPGPT